MTSEALSWWLRWAGEWTARAWFPFDPDRREQLVDAFSNYRWAGELLGDAALARAHGAQDAISWFRQLRSTGGEVAPWAAPMLLGAFYVHGVMRRSLQAPRLIASAADAWMTGNRELLRTLEEKKAEEEQPDPPESV